MQKRMRCVVAGVTLAAIALGAGAALAQKSGGTLKLYHRGTPPSGSIHEEATNSTVAPYMGVFNNLVVFDQHEPVNSLDTIVPDLAESWSWSDDNKSVTFKLRQGVTWHDGKPFTSADVKCTWDLLLGKSKAKLRKNPRQSWYWNLKDVSTNGDFEAIFHLGQPQPSLLALLASGYSPVYPCHVSPKDMRTAPIGTGPYKFVSLKQNEHVKFEKNPNYWKKGLPYVDAIEHTIIKSRSTRVLAFINGDFDITFDADVTVPLRKDVMAQSKTAICPLLPTNVSTNLIINRDSPPFDNETIRTAMALAMDRNAFTKIISEGEDDIGGALLPAPEGKWGLTAAELKDIPGYGDVEASREKARGMMKGLGYGPDNRLKIKVSTRNIAIYRDPAVILIDHLKEIYIDAELEVIETSNWHATVARKAYQVGLNLTGHGVDDPDVDFFENYACGSQRNYTGYCNKELQALFVKQSGMTDLAARQKLVKEIDRKLQIDQARPILYHGRAATCYHNYVKNFTPMANSVYNGWRLEDVWLDK